MIVALSVLMFFIPAGISVIIHNYLRHGEVSTKKKLALFICYLCIINATTYVTSYLRGVKTIDFRYMTVSYRLKYMGLGSVLGFFMPFVVCLFTEDIITVGGFIRYAKKFVVDMKKYLPYAIWSAKADLGAEVASSYLNWLWWLIEPICTMLIYTVIFGVVFRASEPYFPIFIFIGITLWGFFSRTVSASVDIVRNSAGIITKVYIPKYMLLLSKMFVNAFKMLISLGVVVLMLIVFRVPISWNVIWVIPILIVLFLFTFGVASIMMHYGVYVNDLGYITGIILSILMYLTGTFYSISKRMPEPFGTLLENFNPVAYFISSMRGALLYCSTPSAITLMLWLAISLVLIALGVFNVYSNENAYAKVI